MNNAIQLRLLSGSFRRLRDRRDREDENKKLNQWYKVMPKTWRE